MSSCVLLTYEKNVIVTAFEEIRCIALSRSRILNKTHSAERKCETHVNSVHDLDCVVSLLNCVQFIVTI